MDGDAKEQEDVEVAATVDADHRREPQEGDDRVTAEENDGETDRALSTSRRARKRGLGKDNNDSQAKKIRVEKEEMERKMNQEKNERKRRYEERERGVTSGSSCQSNRRRRTVGHCAGVEEETRCGWKFTTGQEPP
ncbi:unnamed protein product [Caenorhabditis nigoni]